MIQLIRIRRRESPPQVSARARFTPVNPVWFAFLISAAFVSAAIGQEANETSGLSSTQDDPVQTTSADSTKEEGANEDGANSQQTAEHDEAAASPQMLIVVGAGGGEPYKSVFSSAATQLSDFATSHSFDVQTIGLEPPDSATDLEVLEQFLREASPDSDAQLWLILIGHGTFDGATARFNLRGPDLSGQELAKLLTDFKRPLIVVNCSSASAPFMNALSGPNRIVITSTKSGFEQNFSYFATHFVNALGSADADLDKDEQTSLLESFLFASARVAEYYDSEDRLVTEHALLDDNGDKLGTPPDWFEGVRVVQRDKSDSFPDGPRAHQVYISPSALEQRLTPDQRSQRNRLELELEQLRLNRKSLPESQYLEALEGIVSQLAELYAQIDEPASQPNRPVAGSNDVQPPLPEVRAPRPPQPPSN